MSTERPHGAGRDPLDPRKLLREAVAAGGGSAGAAAGGFEPLPVEELAKRFPELEVVELIGRGGMGAVYRAVQPKLGRTVALKALPPELQQDPAFEERFLREARTLATLQHPRILTLYDFGERDGLFFLVTEFVEGMNLRQLMDMGELSPHEALRIAPQICEALQFAHDRGVVHRDVKPENILVDGLGEVHIADFGLARLVDDPRGMPALTRSTQVVGTPHYMAPEQWRSGGGAIDHRADIYSIGVVLYEMLTGQLPLGHFELPSKRHGVPKGLDQVVQKSLAQRPEQRYQTASEVGDDVRRQQDGAARPAAVRGDDDAAKLPGALRLAWTMLVVTMLGLGALVIALLQRRQSGDGDAVRGAMRGIAESASFAFASSALLGVLVLLVMLTFTVCGFKAIAAIRSGRSTRGAGLAVFTAWITPIVIAAMVPGVILDANMRDGDTAMLAGIVIGVVVSALGIAWMWLQTRALQRDVQARG